MSRRWNGGFISSSSQSTGFATLTGISKLGTSLRLNMVPLDSGGEDEESSPFPSVYETVIADAIATTDYVYYVDATNGNDSNDGTTAAAAFASINQLNTTMNALTSNSVTAIVYPGEYNITPTAGYSGSQATVPFKDFGYARKIICAPGKVDFIWTAGAERDAPLVDFGSTDSQVYGAVFKRDNNGRTAKYSVAFHNDTTTKGSHQLYNCAIEETNANGNWSLQYDNSNNSVGKWYNCTVAVNEAGDNDYSGASGFVITDTVFNYTYGTGNASKVSSEILSAHNLNFTTYEGSDTGTDGVYYGTYGWPADIAAWRTANR